MKGSGTGEVNLDDKQGGKKFGELKKKQEDTLNKINEEILDDSTYKEIEDLEGKLEAYKCKYMEIDLMNIGYIDIPSLKLTLEKLEQSKTHYEVMKMVREVDTTNTDTICYRDFLRMMLGSGSSVLKLILMFEEKGRKRPKPTGPPRKRHIESLIAQ